MKRRRSKLLWVLSVLLIALVWGCDAEDTPIGPTESASSFDELAFWEHLPLPDDAEVIPIAGGIDLGFTTGMIEPELFDFYAVWLEEQGWRQQAPTEAMITLPRRRWRKDGNELLIEIPGRDEQGRTIVRLQVAKR